MIVFSTSVSLSYIQHVVHVKPPTYLALQQNKNTHDNNSLRSILGRTFRIAMMSPMTCLALHILVVLVNISGALRNLHFIRLSFTSERHHSKTSLRERTLLIDNYDSYTYNLFQLIASISGVEPYVVYNNALGGCWQDVVNHALPFDNIVISPGPGHPSNPVDFGICKDAIQYAHVPILGVCLGYQGLVTTNGGKVLKAPTPMHGRLSTIYHTSKGIFAGVQNASRAVRYHSLVAESVLPEELEVTAWTLDGLGMGLQHKTKPHYGVQFHPESIKTPIGRKIMENFISISRQHRKHIPRKSPFPTNAHPLTISSNISSQSSITSSSTNTTKKVFVYSLNASAYSVPMIDVFEHLYGNVSTSFLLDSECAGPGASFPTPYPQRSGMSIMGAASSKGSYVLEYDHNRELTIQWYNEHTGELDSGVAVNANLLSYIRQQVSKQHSVECFLNGRLFSDDILPQLNGLLHGGMFGYLS
ncbi:aminodeoxychorismate/anthranilate synthase component II, partial [archaeon]